MFSAITGLRRPDAAVLFAGTVLWTLGGVGGAPPPGPAGASQSGPAPTAAARGRDTSGVDLPGARGAPIVGAIRLVGLRFTQEDVVVRELELKPGNSFDPEKFAAGLRALEKLDIFAEIEGRTEGPPDSLTLVYRFREIPLLVPHPTGEYTEENGLAVGFGVLSTNLWGRNHSLEASYKYGFEAGGVRRVSLEYTLPRLWGARSRAALWLADTRRTDEINEFREVVDVARLEVYQHLLYRTRDQVIAKLHLSIERVGADRDAILLSQPLCPCGEAADVLPAAGLSAIYDSRNYQGNPTRGSYAEAGLTRFGGPLGGDVDYWMGVVDLRWYHPTGPRHHLLFSQLVSTQSGSPNATVPIYRKFWMGGANSVRGYALDEQGGFNQALWTVEFRFLAMKPQIIPLYLFDWYVDLALQPVVGLDVGTTWDDGPGDAPWLHGATIGLQLLVPYVQMVRFEAAVGDYLSGNSISAQFHMGTPSKPIAQRFRRR